MLPTSWLWLFPDRRQLTHLVKGKGDTCLERKSPGESKQEKAIESSSPLYPQEGGRSVGVCPCPSSHATGHSFLAQVWNTQGSSGRHTSGKVTFPE